jgi:hypothetical protein
MRGCGGWFPSGSSANRKLSYRPGLPQLGVASLPFMQYSATTMKTLMLLAFILAVTTLATADDNEILKRRSKANCDLYIQVAQTKSQIELQLPLVLKQLMTKRSRVRSIAMRR